MRGVGERGVGELNVVDVLGAGDGVLAVLGDGVLGVLGDEVLRCVSERGVEH